MKYIYMVTRIVTGDKHGSAVPTLGCHTSLKLAIKHFNDIVEDRVGCGATLQWRHNLPQSKYNNRAEEALLVNGEESERLFIERWRV